MHNEKEHLESKRAHRLVAGEVSVGSNDSGGSRKQMTVNALNMDLLKIFSERKRNSPRGADGVKPADPHKAQETAETHRRQAPVLAKQEQLRALYQSDKAALVQLEQNLKKTGILPTESSLCNSIGQYCLETNRSKTKPLDRVAPILNKNLKANKLVKELDNRNFKLKNFVREFESQLLQKQSDEAYRLRFRNLSMIQASSQEPSSPSRDLAHKLLGVKNTITSLSKSYALRPGQLGSPRSTARED